MNIEIANLVNKQKSELHSIPLNPYIKRDLSDRFIKALNSKLIKVITGPRRAGKSTLAIQTLKDFKLAYLNFEDEDFKTSFSGEDIIKTFEVIYPGYEYILFDEIQLFPSWEKFLNRLERLGKNVIVTGSNSKLLSTELSSSLTGRHINFELLPFSYHEYLKVNKENISSSSFHSYLKTGGFPAVLLGAVTGKDFLLNLWDSILLKDIVERYRIRKSPEIKSLLSLVRSQISSRASVRNIEQNLDFALNHTTIEKFLSYAESAYLSCLLQAYSHKSKIRIKSDRKIYLFDNGFYTAQQNSSATDLGRLLENYFFIELFRYGLKPNLDYFHYLTRRNYEVDFYVAKSKLPASLLQICYSLAEQRTLEREIRGLVTASKELKVDRLFIITSDGARRIVKEDGMLINIIPAWEFDLEADLLK
jgi:predicted AAA+ superfamily ATPase